MTKEEDTDYGILMPKELAEEALNSHNCIGAAYTYNVPVFSAVEDEREGEDAGRDNI